MNSMSALHKMKTMAAYLARGPSCNQTNGLPDGGKTFNWAASVRSSRTARMKTHQRHR